MAAMKALLMALTCLSLLAVPLFVTGCNDAHAAAGFSQPPTGKSCTVQFRRDALGAASQPISPTTDRISGIDTSASGTLKMASEEWVVLSSTTGKDLWIPKSAVLLISF
jgi:hypothetical protein